MKISKKLYSPVSLFTYSLLWLFVLTFVGTISQQEIGLYQSQQRYFSSLVFWAGPVPLPGGTAVLSLIFFLLLHQLIFNSPWKKLKAGIFIAHLGALLLLAGGLLTNLFSFEGSMVIPEGGKADFLTSYHDLELVVKETTDPAKDAVTAFAQTEGYFKPQTMLEAPYFPFKLSVQSFYPNTTLIPRESLEANSVPSKAPPRGFASRFLLASAERRPTDEENRAGIIFELTGAGANRDGEYSVFLNMPIAQTLKLDDGRQFVFELRLARTHLPFSISLIDFKKENYAATDKARSYSSLVILNDPTNHLEQKALIEMNAPLRYKGYTLYQASFMEGNPGGGERETTVLAVVHNLGRTIPYIASIIICLGLLLHLWLRSSSLSTASSNSSSSSSPPKTRKTLATIFFLLASFSWSGTNHLLYANDSNKVPENKLHAPAFDLATFAQIPILHEGRLKPLDTFARIYMMAIAGKSSTPSGEAAIAWLAHTIFEPYDSYQTKIFTIKNKEVLDALSLPRAENPAHPRHYSLYELSMAFKSNAKLIENLRGVDEKELSPTQKQLRDLYSLITAIYDLSRSLSVLVSDILIGDPAVAKALDLPVNTPLNYLQVYSKRTHFGVVKNFISSKNPNEWSRTEVNLVALIDHMRNLDFDAASQLLRIIPTPLDEKKEFWYSPWRTIQEGKGTPFTAEYFSLWQSMSKAYREKNHEAWQTATAATQSFLQKQLPVVSDMPLNYSPQLLKLENFYNQSSLFHWGIGLYIASFLALALSWIVGGRVKKLLEYTSFGLLTLGFLGHSAGLIMRCWIMKRPPVSTLYESIIFVSWVTVLGGLTIDLFEMKRIKQKKAALKKSMGTLVSSVSGTVLLFLSLSYANEGDTMGTLVAVLNTNFWLGTHVVTITIGYGLCFVSGILGHLYLLKQLLPSRHNPNKKTELADLHRTLVSVTLCALFFAMLGTILGGIWADQSWGRFWGWDPKENGAMLICLWLLFVIHGRISGLFPPIAHAAMASLVNIVVALAWFGVNLLNVGLHSYGFTDNVAGNLGFFCLGEIVTISILWILIQYQRTLEGAK
jgi:ABC-type transport system involved in cytochrome c biogenesis permease subunit